MSYQADHVKAGFYNRVFYSSVSKHFKIIDLQKIKSRSAAARCLSRKRPLITDKQTIFDL